MARTEDLLGAAVFSRFYLDLSPRILESTRDAVLFAQLSHPKCLPCSASVRSSEDARVDGVTVEGGIYVWGDVYTGPVGGQIDGELWWVQETTELTDAFTYSADGLEVAVLPGGRTTVTTVLGFTDGFWQVFDVALDIEDEQ